MSQPLVDRWIDGWAHLRRLRTGQVWGVRLVHVGSTSRRSEVVCVAPSPALFASLLDHIDGDRGAMLTVLGPAPVGGHAASLRPGIRLDRDDETFMTTSLRTGALPYVDPAFRARWQLDGDRATYTLERDGRIAAEGTVGLLRTDAVLDGVETLPRYQRQGLGSHVLGALTAHAVRHGATTGLLVASAPGRALYEDAGWSPTLPMLSLIGVRP